jgi:tetraacyldisaccharide 4'-kinase
MSLLHRKQPLLEKIWYGRSMLKTVLRPVSLVYQAAAITKRYLYCSHFLKSTRFDVPVIIVGNITVGGTGKTPFCIALCEHLKILGYKPGLVSRGYGGRAKSWPQTVTVDSDPSLVGDEPVLLVQRTQCPMVVASDRVAAVQQLLEQYDCDVVISDDGLQHYRLARDVELILLDNTRLVGNGLCLPAGPLREPVSRLQSADLIIKNGSSQMQIVPGDMYALLSPQQTIQPSDVIGKRVCAMAGIGNPQRFFNTLSELGFKFTPHIFADHYAYTRQNLHGIDADIILMTEKDAVKCVAIADERCYVLPINACLSETVLSAIMANLALMG